MSTVDLHPVKTETFDLESQLNVDPKGFKRSVDVYREQDFGLYMARGADHPSFGYLESWLLPEMNLRANIFHFRPGHEKEQDFYFDVADISRDGDIWTTRDLYVDLVTCDSRPLEVLDVDELSTACSEGLITAAEAELAIETTLAAVEGMTRCGDDPMAWLKSQGIELFWAESVELSPAG